MENITIKLIFQLLLLLFGFLTILLTILPLFKFSHWIFRIGDFPRLQIAILCLFTLLTIPLFFPLSNTVILLEFILTFSFAYQLSCIFPYTKFHSKQVEKSNVNDSDARIKLLISNVFIDNKNSEKLLKLIKRENPDIILLAEVDDLWDKNVEELKTKYPNHLCHPLDNAYGMNFYTRLETEGLQLNFYVEDDIPSVESLLKLPNGKLIKFYGLHPRPPYPAENHRSAERDAEVLIVAKKIQQSSLPTIIAGDFNDVAWSATTNLFQRISGVLDSRIGRGFYNSFHAKIWLLRMPLDHVFQTNHFRLVDIKRLESIDSDHFPIFIELSYESDAKESQDELENNEKDEIERVEKIKEVKEN